MINLAILSSPILLEDGTFHRAEITLTQAKTLINAFSTTNYTQHSVCNLLDVEPAKERLTCESYDVAIVVKPNIRLEYGREYSVEEIEEIGYKIVVIWKQSIQIMTDKQVDSISLKHVTGEVILARARFSKTVVFESLHDLVDAANHYQDWIVAYDDEKYDRVLSVDDAFYSTEDDAALSAKRQWEKLEAGFDPTPCRYFPISYVDFLHVDNQKSDSWRDFYND